MRKKLLVLFLVIAMMLDVTGIATTDLNAQTTVSVAKKKKMVYITPTGKCYHRCKCGRGTYSKVTLKYAKSLGLRPCRRRACYG